MKMIVCVKQVPDTTEVRIDPETNTLIRQGVPSIVNPFDRNAVEAALVLKAQHGGEVIVISMGPPQAAAALKDCLAMGADRAVLISDRVFGGADTLATSYTLAAAIRKIGSCDLIICGKQAIDGDTAQVGPEIAEYLGIAQVTYAEEVNILNGTARIKREHEDGLEVIDVKLPALLTVLKSMNEPRLPDLRSIVAAHRAKVDVWRAADLEVNKESLGINGSPTQVRKIFTPSHNREGRLIRKESAREAVAELMHFMHGRIAAEVGNVN